MVISKTCRGSRERISTATSNDCMQSIRLYKQPSSKLTAALMFVLHTFMGGKRANGAWPCASSRMVMPKDQMSARELYLGRRITAQAQSMHGTEEYLQHDFHRVNPMPKWRTPNAIRGPFP